MTASGKIMCNANGSRLHWCVLLLFVVSSVAFGAAWAQETGRVVQPHSTSGMATGGVHAPVKDSKSRPITAGGFVDGAPQVFADITKQAGLDKFHHRSGGPEKS